MNCIYIYLLVGGGLGAVLGYFNRCRTSACPLTANWRRGAVYGAVLAAFFYSIAGCVGDPAAMNQSTANVKYITDTNFDAEVMQASQPVVVDCYATWCGPCRELAPTVDKLADQYAGKIKFCKVNVDDSPKTTQKFQIDAIPRLLFFKGGKLVDSTVGLLSKEELAGRLDALVATNVLSTANGK
jgi:thioredoxin 1